MAAELNDYSDVFIIGGGISGAAIAAECSQKGLSVTLCDQADVGGASSSLSDQIMPGALHFLRHHNLPYFNKVLKEKARLKKRAPHLYSERSFVVIPKSTNSPSPLSRLWLWFFRHWLQGQTDSNEHSSTASAFELEPLKQVPRFPWLLQEGMIDDARLVIENLLLASKLGARVLPHYKCISAKRIQGCWHLVLCDENGEVCETRSKCLINAAGAKVNQVQQQIADAQTRCWIELKRKNFLVLPKFYTGEQAYFFETEAGLLSVCPHQSHYCLVALTCPDVTRSQDNTITAHNQITEQEQTAILNNVNQRFKTELTPQAILRAYSVQQPYYSDYCDRSSPTSSSGLEDYVLDLNCNDGRSPLISVFGGSFATHRIMAVEASELLSHYIRLQHRANGVEPALPGGDFNGMAYDQFILHLAGLYPWLPGHLLQHYCRTYGARSLILLDGCCSIADLGAELCPGLLEIEARFLCEQEWASQADDVLWRRTRLGLHASQDDIKRLEIWLQRYFNSPSVSSRYTMSNSMAPKGRVN
jgi:glycerol-3-phosphate dehydrogenase